MRTGLEGVMSLVAGPLGGLLAAAPFAWTAGTGALVVGVVVPVTLTLYREPRGAVRDAAVWAAAGKQLRNIVRSRPMWMTSILLFLVYLAPGLQTPLLFYQQDVLKLDVRFMGILQFVGGAGVLGGSAVYLWLCRRLPLRLTLIGGILVNASSALLYLAYRTSTAALIIETTVGFVGVMGTLPLYDLAVRATPRGSEGFGYALMMSVRNIALFGVSDVVGSMLYGRYHMGFERLVWINAGSSAAVLLFVPFLPVALLASREGNERAGTESS
jgi:Na+/melibiose symporter-like transporter